MSKLKEAQAEILDTLLSKHLAGKLQWKPREDEDSFEAKAGTFNFHVDWKPTAVANYRIWVFDKLGNKLDSFDTKDLTDYKPAASGFETFTKVAGTIFQDVNESLTLNKVEPALSALREI